MPVVFDSTFLIPIFFPSTPVPAAVDRARQRLDYLVQQLSKSGEVIVVPTPALAELLVYAQNDGPKLLAELHKDKNFNVAEFGIRAAVELASWTARAIDGGDKRQGVEAPWQKVKFDRQICAIGRVEGATIVYSDDTNVRAHAQRLGMDAKGLDGLPLPPDPPQRDLGDPEWGNWA